MVRENFLEMWDLIWGLKEEMGFERINVLQRSREQLVLLEYKCMLEAMETNTG